MKGNMFLGYARGSVGDVTFTRLKGQQVGRARNRQPSNPRTINQSMQRALFANCVKFHSRGVQQLFKFAFEDKRSAESDYNAFMRHNIKASVRISKQASQSSIYPALGNWMMSFGSMRAPQVTFTGGSDSTTWRIELPSATSNMNTWGELSECLKSDLGCMEDDILTVVHIVAVGATTLNMPSIEPPTEIQPSSWYLSQYKVNTGSTLELPFNYHLDDGFMIIDTADITSQSYCQGLAFILSRNTAQGLKVSTSYLVPNGVAQAVIDNCSDASYLENVIQSWESSDMAILQGALITEQKDLGNIVTWTDPALPVTSASLTIHLSRDEFYKTIREGDVVGNMTINNETYNLVVINAGSTITLEIQGLEGTLVGMRTSGATFTAELSESMLIKSVIIYDI